MGFYQETLSTLLGVSHRLSGAVVPLSLVKGPVFAQMHSTLLLFVGDASSAPGLCT